jgi:hypothetical protein
MPYHEDMNSIVTLSKRNHRYYGPTESGKVDSSLTEIATDLKTIFNELTDINDSIEALASGYLSADGNENSLYDMQREVSRIRGRIDNRINVQSQRS